MRFRSRKWGKEAPSGEHEAAVGSDVRLLDRLFPDDRRRRAAHAHAITAVSCALHHRGPDERTAQPRAPMVGEQRSSSGHARVLQTIPYACHHTPPHDAPTT